MGLWEQPEHVDATFYAVITPQWSRRTDEKNRPILESASVDRITKKRPGQVRGDAVVTRLTLRIDATALLPLQPQAIVHIHADDVEVIEVTADDPSCTCDPRHVEAGGIDDDCPLHGAQR